jgi:CRISPR/Cas system-associated endonuclease Cas3-HD
MRTRKTKEDKYKEEREELIKELENLIGLNESNRKILSNDLEREEIKARMRELSEKISKIYSVSRWGYYSKDIKKGMGNEITLLRSVFKNSGYNIVSKRKTIERDGKKGIESEIYFYKE